MIMILDATGAPTYASPSVERIMGSSLNDLQRVGVLSMIHPDDLQSGAESLAAVLSTSGAHPATVLRFRQADGSWREIEMVANNMLDDPAVAGVVYNARDVTERKALAEQLRHQAFHDPLTGLANRVLFADRLAHALDRARRTRDLVAVLFVDVDNFKSINDAFGHSVGDELLVGIARRIDDVLRPGDTAARFGGDEFTLLLEGLTPSDAMTVGERIIAALRLPFEIAGRDLFVEVSIGVAVGVRDEATVDGLLRDADAAMYVAKSRGKARAELYDKRMHVSMHDRLRLLADLQRAIELEQFVVQYQPTFELASGHLVGAEALVRWNHPERGMLPPLEFIPLAEEGGVIHALGAWVLREACAQLRRWQEEYPQDPPLHMAVNVSGHQLQPGIVDEVKSVLADSNIEPSTLVIEVTESVMMRDVPSTVALLNQLKAIGVRLAIDDFGTGYSSLSYLRQFPFDILKIDKSFVDDLGSDRQHELIGAIVEIGRTLHLELAAEGIESADQLDRLLSLQCDVGQGYYLAKPLFATDMEALLREQQTRRRAA
jgi:diguanylate cyclase (GGDEF)-like protein/PAS domain S-box-containing protein